MKKQYINKCNEIKQLIKTKYPNKKITFFTNHKTKLIEINIAISKKTVTIPIIIDAHDSDIIKQIDEIIEYEKHILYEDNDTMLIDDMYTNSNYKSNPNVDTLRSLSLNSNPMFNLIQTLNYGHIHNHL